MSAVEPPQPPIWLPAMLSSERPLSPPDPALAAVQSSRMNRGFTADGLDHPRGRWWFIGVLPVALADAVAAALLWVSPSVLAGIVVAVLSVAIVGLAIAVHRDPLRINTSQRRRLNRAHVWHSGNDWIPPLTDAPERAQLARAQQAAQRIVSSTYWWQEAATQARLGLDLVTELDEVDGQAFRLALLGDAGQGRAQLQELLEHRVQALVALADELEQQDRRSAAVPTHLEPSGEAVAGGVLDEYATDRLVDLTRALRESQG